MNQRRVIRGLIVAAIASAAVYIVLAVVTDADTVGATLREFPLDVFLGMLLLSLGCFLVRSIRWGGLMRLVGHPVSFADSLYLQLSGQTMTVTPGRVGEVLKATLAKEVGGLPMAAGVALVFCERVADLIAVAILSLGGAALIRNGEWVVSSVAVLIGVGVLIAGSEWFHRVALRAVEKQAWARSHQASAAVISETIKSALSWRTLSWSVPASVIAWGLEGVGMWLCVRALGFDELSILATVSVYAVSTILGAFTFLPGGIGLTEASMAGLLIATGMSAPDASAATLLVRVATLWWGVGIGWAFLASRPRILKGLFTES